MRRTRVFIAGSCVARDTIETMRADVDLLAYVARQSWISAVSPPTRLLQPTLTSRFQQRMVDEDLGSTLLDRLREHADRIEVLLLDLTDERLGVLELPDGSRVTWSQELRESEAVPQAKEDGALRGDVPVVEFGTPRHRELWAEAAERVVATLAEGGLLERTLLLDVPWAARTSAGTPIRGYQGRPVEEWNPIVADYAAVLTGLGVRSLTLPADLAVGADDHQWGQAAYHYADAAYAHLRDGISAFGPSTG